MAKLDQHPEIAVVIPTRFRETRLAFALESLAEQTLAPERFEVIVVRAPDAVEGPLAKAPTGLPVRFLTSEAAGPAVQRNLGWRAARAPWVAFTDDDCRVKDDWLERLLEAGQGQETVLMGRTEPDPDERHLLWGLARSWEITELNDWYATCNIAYPRATLERVGGFDESFPSAWGEDTDLGFRAREAGVELRYVDGALAWHAVLPRTLPETLREARRLGATATVIKRHPSHREGLYAGVFVQARHAYLPLALAGVAISRRHPLVAALAALPYLKRTFDWRNPSPRRLLRQAAHLPTRVVVDMAEMSQIARAAARERVLVL